MRFMSACLLMCVLVLQPASASDLLAKQARMASLRAMVVFGECSSLVGEAEGAYKLNLMDKFQRLQADRIRCEEQAPSKAKAHLAGLRKSLASAGKSDALLKEFYSAFNVAIGKLSSASRLSEANAIQASLESKADRLVADLDW